MGSVYVGLDVHSRESVFAIKDAGGVLRRGVLPTSAPGLRQLRDEQRLPPGTPIALESGTSAFFVARELARLGVRPVVVDAHEVRRKAHRPLQKSDHRDAFELCDGISRDLYRSVVHVPEPEICELRTTLSRRRHFIRIQTAEVNAAKRLLRAAGRSAASRQSLRTAASWERLLQTTTDGAELETHLPLHYAVWGKAAEQVRSLDLALGQQARRWREEVRRLETLPGVGPIVALTTIAVFSEVSRFPSAKHAASYTGIVPSTYESGDHRAHGRITRRGSAELRTVLCEAAHHARRSSHPLHPYFAKLVTRHGYKRAIVAVAYRLCRVLYAMLRDGTEFRPERMGIEEGTFTRTATFKYRLTPKPPGRASRN